MSKYFVGKCRVINGEVWKIKAYDETTRKFTIEHAGTHRTKQIHSSKLK